MKTADVIVVRRTPLLARVNPLFPQFVEQSWRECGLGWGRTFLFRENSFDAKHQLNTRMI